MDTQKELLSIIFEKDEVTWQNMMLDLVKSEEMNPWDIDIKLIVSKYLELIRTMKKLDFRIPGKVILAAAILLRIKSKRLLTEDLENLDRLFSTGDEEEGLLDELYDKYEYDRTVFKEKKLELIPRTPQPRKRKVSIYDLVDALQRAMIVKKRRVMRNIPPIEVTIPKKSLDITKAITTMYGKITEYFTKNTNKLTFSQLIPSENKMDKIYTFIPLLHLNNEQKLNLFQWRHFGEIEIKLNQKQNKKELEEALT